MKKIAQKTKELNLANYAVWPILIIAMATRFTGLVRRDFWYDEAFTGVAVKESFSNMIEMIINDVHPPLYYIALKSFSYFFDYSVYGIRFFSAIFGVLSIWALYLLTKELFDKKVACFAALLATISPFAIQYSQEARMYSMLVFFILISAYFFAKGTRTSALKWFLLWGFFVGLSALTHYMGIIFASSYYFVFVVTRIFRIDSVSLKLFQRLRNIAKSFVPSRNLLAGYGVALVIFLPWLRIFIHHVLAKGNNLSWVKPASLGDIIVVIQMFLFGTPLGEMSSGMPQPNELHGIAHISIRMAIAVAMGAIAYYLLKKHDKAKVASVLIFSVGFMFIIYLLSVFFVDQQYFVARYLLPGAFFIFIFFALFLSQLRPWINIVLICSYFFLVSLTIPLINSQGYNELILHMDKYKGKNFYILNSFDYVITKYYLGANRLTLYNYDWPQYNPSYWAAIGPDLKRTEDYEDLRHDPNALIISNRVLNRDNQYFSTEGLALVDQYKNILIYKFQN